MDVAAIEPGRDFRRAIEQHVGSCSVLLSVIGRSWLTATDESGARRLDDPLDFVRLETASALKRDIPVVPVLVHGAKMPKAADLPDDLKELAFRNGVELTHARWDSDVQVLLKALTPYVNGGRKPAGATSTGSGGRSYRVPALATAGVAVLALSLGYGAWQWQRTPVDEATSVGSADGRSAGRDAAASAAAADAALKDRQTNTTANAARPREPDLGILAGPPAAAKPLAEPAQPDPAAQAADKAQFEKDKADAIKVMKALQEQSDAANAKHEQFLADLAKEKAKAEQAKVDEAKAEAAPSRRPTATAGSLVQPSYDRLITESALKPKVATVERPTGATGWRAANFPDPNGGFLVWRITPSGDPACASYDGKACLWGVRYTELDRSRLRPLICGEVHRVVWGQTGYEDPRHWCNLARKLAAPASPAPAG
jgi:hypothetical protein